MNSEYCGQIRDAFTQGGIQGLPDADYERFLTYLELLLKWNARLNLTAIREPGEIIRRHFVECAFAARNLPVDVETLMDFGSGAGFPGIPIAICRRELRVTLAEAMGKKASFLREAVRNLAIPSEVFEGRVERMPQERQFDAVILRAVEKMETAIPLAAERAKRHLVLLIGANSAAAYQQLAPEFEWNRAIPLPDSMRSVLLAGERTDWRRGRKDLSSGDS